MWIEIQEIIIILWVETCMIDNGYWVINAIWIDETVCINACLL